MKKKVTFHVTIGDYYWPERYGTEIRFPIMTGNYSYEFIPVEFDWDEKEDIMLAANRQLKLEMGDKKYLVWYWSWLL